MWSAGGVAVLLLLVCSADALFWFHVTADKPTCFTEEVGLEAATLHVRYKVKVKDTHQHANSEHLGSMSAANSVRPFTVLIRAAGSGQEIMTRRVGDLKGSVLAKIDDVTPQVDVCFTADPAQVGAIESPIELRAEIDHRHKALKRDDAPKRKTVKGSGPGGLAIETFVDEDGQVKEVLKTQTELAHIHRTLEDMKLIMDDLKDQAETFTQSQRRFSDTSESTNERVWLSSFITVGIVVATSVYQYHHLKGFLMKKKLV